MDNYYVSKLLPLMAEAGVAVIANPNISIQSRHDTHPKRRDMTRIPEMLTYGITCAFGQDCMMRTINGQRLATSARNSTPFMAGMF